MKWTPESESPNGVVQIVHGLSEHAERYNHFANFLTRHGFAVYSHDHRGHGKTDPDSLGHIESTDGFHLMAENINDVYQHISSEYSDTPHILLGHSMGSFLVQRLMQISNLRPDGIIYSGSNGKPPAMLRVGIFLSKVISKMYGPDAKGELLFKMTFGSYNNHFKPIKTEVDWLSRDPEMVQLYADDPLCNAVPTASFFRHMFEGVQQLHSHRPFSDHNPNIPILILSGDSDPVSNMGKGIRNLEKLIIMSGVQDLQVLLYPGGRHEMLNETNREEVMNDILNWINRILAR